MYREKFVLSCMLRAGYASKLNEINLSECSSVDEFYNVRFEQFFNESVLSIQTRTLLCNGVVTLKSQRVTGYRHTFGFEFVLVFHSRQCLARMRAVANDKWHTDISAAANVYDMTHRAAMLKMSTLVEH